MHILSLVVVIAFGWKMKLLAASTSMQSGKCLIRSFWAAGSQRTRLPSLYRVSIRGGSTRPNMDETINQDIKHYQCILGIGSNMGERFQNVVNALDLLFEEPMIDCHGAKVSFLYETSPMYVTDQPKFLNGALEVFTTLEPYELLSRLKAIESRLGRDFNTVRNGPRPIDLDILLYRRINEDDTKEDLFVETPELTVPHPRISERDFVLAPLIDILGDCAILPGSNLTLRESLASLIMTQGDRSVIRVLPLPRGRFLHFNRTLVMGILNVTPDSFSDGGKWTAESAVQRALEMEREGADIVDIGGESTRPGALEVQIDEELQRTIPVIEGIRKESDIPISIDTRHSDVARAAIKAGADIVNDVSGGLWDVNMLPTVARLGPDVPMIIMHMRGTPISMQNLTVYNDVLQDVTNELSVRCDLAEQNGIRRWRQVVDPGIGFAKNITANLMLLVHLDIFRQNLGNLPVMLGTSRKAFIGKLTGVDAADQRDPGTIASCVSAICLAKDRHRLTSTILRVHNVRDCKQAVQVMDALMKQAALVDTQALK